MVIFGGSKGGTPSPHPFLVGIFHEINHPMLAIGVPPWLWKHPSFLYNIDDDINHHSQSLTIINHRYLSPTDSWVTKRPIFPASGSWCAGARMGSNWRGPARRAGSCRRTSTATGNHPAGQKSCNGDLMGFIWIYMDLIQWIPVPFYSKHWPTSLISIESYPQVIYFIEIFPRRISMVFNGISMVINGGLTMV